MRFGLLDRVLENHRTNSSLRAIQRRLDEDRKIAEHVHSSGIPLHQSADPAQSTLTPSPSSAITIEWGTTPQDTYFGASKPSDETRQQRYLTDLGLINRAGRELARTTGRTTPHDAYLLYCAPQPANGQLRLEDILPPKVNDKTGSFVYGFDLLSLSKDSLMDITSRFNEMRQVEGAHRVFYFVGTKKTRDEAHGDNSNPRYLSWGSLPILYAACERYNPGALPPLKAPTPKPQRNSGIKYVSR